MTSFTSFTHLFSSSEKRNWAASIQALMPSMLGAIRTPKPQDSSFFYPPRPRRFVAPCKEMDHLWRDRARHLTERHQRTSACLSRDPLNHDVLLTDLLTYSLTYILTYFTLLYFTLLYLLTYWLTYSLTHLLADLTLTQCISRSSSGFSNSTRTCQPDRIHISWQPPLGYEQMHKDLRVGSCGPKAQNHLQYICNIYAHIHMLIRVPSLKFLNLYLT